MASTIHQIAVHLSHLVVTQFLLIWLVALEFILFWGLVATDAREGTKRSVWPTRVAERIAGMGFVLFLLSYALLTLLKERLADFDNDVLWSLALLLMLLCALLVSNRQHPIFAKPQAVNEPAAARAALWPKSGADWAAAIAFLLLMACYLGLIFYKQDFTWYDDEVFTDFSVQGKNFAPAIWPSQGRFFPLEVQEFNYLSWITRSSAGFHSFALVELLIVIVALAVVLREYRVWQRALVVMAAMLAPGILISFMGLIYPERNVLLWLAILVVCLAGYSRTRGAGYFLGCLVATHFALYYKEPVAVFVVAFAVTRMLIGSTATRRAPGWWRGLIGRNALSLGMLGVAGIFVVLFAMALFPRASGNYVETHHVSLVSVLWAYTQTDWLLIVLVVALGCRVRRFLFSGAELDWVWEPLAAGALGYFFAVFALGLYSGYYMAPVDLIAVLYTGRLAVEWLAKPTRGRVSAAATVFLILMLHNAAYCAFRVVETKSLIAEKAQFADYLMGHAGERDQIELFFPYASKFHLMELSAYLSYRGIRMEGEKAAPSAGGPRVVIEGRGEYPLGRCVDYRAYYCKHVESPGEGAWIVVMPDDDASMADVERAGQGAALLLSAKSCTMCEGEDSWFRELHAISQEYWKGPLPGHWLELHVFKKIAPAVAASGHGAALEPAR